jgi:CBS domain-containing protein
MLTAENVMTAKVVSVTKDAPVHKAIGLMLKNEISGLPVVEQDMTLVGIITEKDVLQLHDDPERAQNLTVEDLMTTPAVFFDKEETFDDICRCLMQSDFRRVPVTSYGKVVGIVSRPDITKHILQTIKQGAVSGRKN